MKPFTKKLIYAALIGLGCFLYFDGIDRAVTWYKHRGISPYLTYPSLRPEVTRTLSVRFDPSFYYERQKHPITLAKELAETWHENGVNLVFFRAYDPRYGAFYKTRYQYNHMGDYGKYDLLSKIIKACHARNIRVFAWFPILNHAGVWEEMPMWRTKTAKGGDYTARGLEFPLDPVHQGVREWWLGFLQDFLTHYSKIDGIDFGEPVVSWGGEQKVSGIQAEALTTLLGDSTALVHQQGKRVCITTTQSASQSGKLLSPYEFKKITGFDLLAVLKETRGRAPDIICPEFIWQELRSRHEKDNEAQLVFKPGWTQNAVRQFMQWIESPVSVIVHVELTDFPNVPVDGDQLKSTLYAAIRGGASGLDVYSSHELDIKNVWPVIREARHIALKKRCLILYDRKDGKNDGIQTGELLRHFNTDIFLKTLDEYKSGMLNEYYATFYVGTDTDASFPDAFVSDLMAGSRHTFCWLGANIDKALKYREVSNTLGIEYLGAIKDQYKKVIYKGQILKNENPWLNMIKVLNPIKCRILANAKGGNTDVPYALRCGQNFWYIADVPSSHAVEGGRFLVFADLLHDILNEDHEARHLAMVRIEDVHPLTNPETLKAIAAFLHDQDVPFQISLVPYYVFPDQNIYVGLYEKPEFVDALKYMVKKGGVVVMHGTTHQRFGETTADYEFWDPMNDQSPEGQNIAFIRERIEKGLKACWSAGIFPLMWETPHYAGSQELYGIVSDYFSIAMERRQAIDQIGTDQYLPYLVPHDRFEQTIVPENLGYVPLDQQDPNVILEPARHMKAVRDGVASFFFHPFIRINVLKQIVRQMKKEGFEFTTIGDLPIRVETPFGMLTNLSGDVTLQTGGFSGLETRGVFPGTMAESQKVYADTGDIFSRNITLRKGELYFVDFTTSDVDVASQKIPSDIEKTKAHFLTVPNFYGEQCRVPRPLLIEPLKMRSGLGNEFHALKDLFSLIGTPVDILNVSRISETPFTNNLVIIPHTSALEMTDSAVKTIASGLKKGKFDLFTSGFSQLSDEMGIEKKNFDFLAESVRDTYYPDVAVQWEPPVPVTAFDAPADSNFIYEDVHTEEPLFISATLNKGRYMFSSTPCTGASSDCLQRYPYLITHMFRLTRSFPLVRKAAAEIYFNTAEREDIAIETLVKEWRRIGVRVIYAAAWQVYPEWTYDYGRLIRLAHTNGMLVYAWFELPHVNERFWLAHPEWRERNALGRDVMVGWHKPMALADKDCFDAVQNEMQILLNQFDWDGIIFNRVGWESESGIQKPETHTPFHASARERIKLEYGYDPAALINKASRHYWKVNKKSLEQFEQWRGQQAQEILNQLLTMLSVMKGDGRDSWEIILTYDENQPHNGISLEDMISLKKQFNVTLQRACSIDAQWREFPDSYDMVRIFLGPKESGLPFYPGAPTSYPTGTAMYTLLGEMIKNHKRFSIFSENAMYDVDRRMLPFLLAAKSHWIWMGNQLSVQSPYSTEIFFANDFSSPVLLDNTLTGSLSKNHIIVPAGDHTLSTGKRFQGLAAMINASARLLDCSADLLDIKITSLGLEIIYRSDQRTVMVVNEPPRDVWIDGIKTTIEPEKGISGWALMLPQGKHVVKIHTRDLPELFLTLFSLALSNTIVLISFFAIISFALISITLIVGRKLKRRS